MIEVRVTKVLVGDTFVNLALGGNGSAVPRPDPTTQPPRAQAEHRRRAMTRRRATVPWRHPLVPPGALPNEPPTTTTHTDRLTPEEVAAVLGRCDGMNSTQQDAAILSFLCVCVLGLFVVVGSFSLVGCQEPPPARRRPATLPPTVALPRIRRLKVFTVVRRYRPVVRRAKTPRALTSSPAAKTLPLPGAEKTLGTVLQV